MRTSLLVACCLLALSAGTGVHASAQKRRTNYPGFFESQRAVNNAAAAAKLNARGGRPFGDAPTHGPVRSVGVSWEFRWNYPHLFMISIQIISIATALCISEFK
jgi:hypothetical protein